MGFFSKREETEAVILTGSCARGKATRDSCLDVIVLVSPEVLSKQRGELERFWTSFQEKGEAFDALLKAGKYSRVDLEFVDGNFALKERSWTSGPDNFELDIGNTLVYSLPLWDDSDYLRRLKEKWLPYYGEILGRERLRTVLRYCRNNLDHIPLYVERGLYFQSFHRLYDAFSEFLQALFISRRTYPIAYDKWVRDQVEGILGLHELYKLLPGLFEIRHFESREIADKADDLRTLLTKYVVEG